MTRKHWALIAAATVLPLVASTGTAVADTPSTGSGTGAAGVTCAYTPAVPADNFKGIPVFDARKAAKPYKATLKTSQGAITFQALTDKAPCTTFSFRFLAERDYFDRSHCHRLTTQRLFVLQCGDPTGTGSGGPGYSFPDENLEGATYPAGTVAMANAGPDTNGSQFFFVWKDTKLSPAYTPFGRVTEGLDVLRRIAAGGEDDQNSPGDGFPTLPVNIRNVKISAR
ncbi:hypothetical protein GCM10009639_39910 [Kitasatospora putterlickiae]|uniref:Peptidyl-prolyl cis-trans isomerase n=1 Tax=Kitasatospora putterlickiae TaxID=221725 RepID=A0ABN1Y756_9ACTN